MILLLLSYLFGLKPQFYALSSLVIPGTGELLLKEKKGEYFIYSDIIFLSFYQTFNFLSKKENENAKIFACQYAKANPLQNEKYFNLLETYSSSEEYNKDVLREARDKFPEDPEKQKEYLKKNGYFDKDSWHWENDSLRMDYFKKRREARNKKMVSSFFLSGSILLRLGSFLNCLFLSKSKKISFEFNPSGFKVSYNF
ncbi:MAG: hypothetical protein N2323_06230 [candidate division WOR-3 bacterium]|nr:hypothetical protein [candidate division WOR-3 bacterium]MCX7837529.1 hypothetical protein [candidate division WOR-3 bacterium]MDW8113976.1 hypothetical protein [candidate division WOR-3 bacterium]